MKDTITYIDIQELTASTDLYDYFFLKLFESSNTIEFYHVRDIFEIFKERYKMEAKGTYLFNIYITIFSYTRINFYYYYYIIFNLLGNRKTTRKNQETKNRDENN